MKTSLSSYIELCKIRIALLSSFSAATGFLLAATELRPEIIILILGVFLLACGSSGLNQYQERETDAAMPRTGNRPLPSGRIKPVNALYFSLWLLFSGTSTLLLTGALSAPLLGLFAVAWYNGVYTFLKKKTAFAVVPGALIGAIPPAIGWIAGGGAMGDTKLLMLCFFFFLWQVPHSWLFIMHYGQGIREGRTSDTDKDFYSTADEEDNIQLDLRHNHKLPLSVRNGDGPLLFHQYRIVSPVLMAHLEWYKACTPAER